MSDFSEIQHKLKRDGYSQLDRNNKLLSPSSIKIDGRKTEDLLQFWYQYARQINFYDIEANLRNETANNNEIFRTGDWVPFFRKSIPFQYAIIAAYKIEALEQRFLNIHKTIRSRLSFESLNLMFDLLFDMTEQPVQWLDDLQYDDSGLKRTIENLIDTNLREQFVKLNGLANAAGKWGYQRNRNSRKLQNSWGINPMELYAVDRSILTLKGSNKRKVLAALAILEQLFRTLWKAMQSIIAEAQKPEQLEKSLGNNDQQDHQPHLGLMFAFLGLFEKAQGGLNSLSEAHLDFFYKKTLQLKKQDILPDQAHLTFELAKQVREAVLIKKGTRFKAGKDGNGKDIFFELDDEVIVSKAKIASLRTLFIDRTIQDDGVEKYDENIHTVEGVYMAPVANSADGKGEADLTETTGLHWPTVGAKSGKWINPDTAQNTPEDHPHARLGFMLASRMLFLREGTRHISIKMEFDKALLKKVPAGFLNTVFTINGETNSLANIIADNTIDTSIPDNQNIANIQIAIGQQQVTLDASVATFFMDLLPDDIFKIYLTTAEGWVLLNDPDLPDEDKPTVGIAYDGEGAEATFEIVLPVSFPPVVAPDAALLETDYGDNLPKIKFELNQEIDSAGYWYNVFREKNICRIDLDVKVCDVRQLVIQSDLALLDINKPFMPFGALPKKNSSNFYIGSEEVFCKRWENIEVNITWKDKPQSLNTYYNAYQNPPLDNNFKANVELLSDKNWIASDSPVKLFACGNSSIEVCPKDCKTAPANHPNISVYWSVYNNSFTGARFCPEMPDIQNGYRADTACGFLKLRLGNQDFLHDQYANTLIRKVGFYKEIPELKDKIESLKAGTAGIVTNTKNTETAIGQIYAHLLGDNCHFHDPQNASGKSTTAKNNTITVDNKTKEVLDFINKITTLDGEIILPNAPYTPLIETLHLNYSAATNTEEHPNEIKFTHLHPFHGTYEQLEVDKSKCTKPDYKTTMLPCFVDEGTLLIGLENYEPGSKLDLFFQMEPASANPDMDKAVVCWEYLRNNEWKPLLANTHVLSDTTNGFIQPGIVQLNIPGDITSRQATIMPDNWHWLKASVLLRTAAISETFSVTTQAARATFVPQDGNDLSRLNDPLAEMTIAKFENPVAGIKAVAQSYASFGGRPEELSPAFYQRISEHLRHKGRAVSLYDYERIILQHFGDIYKVKCITHTLGRRGAEKDFELAPGFVTIVVVPDLAKVNAIDPLRPKLPAATLNDVKIHLRSITSPFVNIEVLNPVYETISVRANVRFHPGKSNTFYKKQLAEDVKQFLAPWAFSETRRDISFGGKIYYSTILNFIEKQSYVDYLKDFEMIDENDVVRNEIAASNSRVVLTSGEHQFTAIETIESFEQGNPFPGRIGYGKIPKN